MANPSQVTETTFSNPEWHIRTRVVGHSSKPGYNVVTEPFDSKQTFLQNSPHYCATLREAVIKAMDIAGV